MKIKEQYSYTIEHIIDLYESGIINIKEARDLLFDEPATLSPWEGCENNKVIKFLEEILAEVRKDKNLPSSTPYFSTPDCITTTWHG